MENEITLARRTVLTAVYLVMIFSVLMLIRSNNKYMLSKQKTTVTVQKTIG
jgi:hypothetical protein